MNKRRKGIIAWLLCILMISMTVPLNTVFAQPLEESKGQVLEKIDENNSDGERIENYQSQNNEQEMEGNLDENISLEGGAVKKKSLIQKLQKIFSKNQRI